MMGTLRFAHPTGFRNASGNVERYFPSDAPNDGLLSTEFLQNIHGRQVPSMVHKMHPTG